MMIVEGLSSMCCIKKLFVRESVCPGWDKLFVFFYCMIHRTLWFLLREIKFVNCNM